MKCSTLGRGHAARVDYIPVTAPEARWVALLRMARTNAQGGDARDGRQRSSMATTPEDPPIEISRLAAGIYLPAFLRMFGSALCGTYIPLYIAEQGASKAVIGIVVGARAAGLLAADVPAGLLVSRLGTRRSMVVGLVGTALAFGLATTAPGVVVLGVLLFLAGFCAALVQISELTIMRHAMPDRVRGRAMSLVGGTFRMAGVAAPLLGGMLVEAAGYPSVFACYAGCLVCACALFACFGPRRQTRPRPKSEGSLAAIARLTRQNWRVLVPAGGTLLVLTVLRASRRLLLPLWGHDMGLSPSAIGMVVSAGAGADTLVFPLGGIVSDKKGRKWSLTGCLGLFSCGLIALAIFGGDLAGFTFVALLIGIGNGLGAGINMTVGTDLAPKGKDTSAFLGLWRVITDTGGMLGPLAVGALAQLIALGPAAVVVGMTGLTGVALMWRFMPEPRGFRQ